MSKSGSSLIAAYGGRSAVLAGLTYAQSQTFSRSGVPLDTGWIPLGLEYSPELGLLVLIIENISYLTGEKTYQAIAWDTQSFSASGVYARPGRWIYLDELMARKDASGQDPNLGDLYWPSSWPGDSASVEYFKNLFSWIVPSFGSLAERQEVLVESAGNVSLYVVMSELGGAAPLPDGQSRTQQAGAKVLIKSTNQYIDLGDFKLLPAPLVPRAAELIDGSIYAIAGVYPLPLSGANESYLRSNPLADSFSVIQFDASGSFVGFVPSPGGQNYWYWQELVGSALYGLIVNGLPSMSVIEGTAEPDFLSGDIGNDTIYGFGGADTLSGGLGDDVLRAGAGADLSYGGEGRDDLYGAAGSDSLYGENEDDRIYGGAGADSLYGGWGNDLLSGGAGEDYLDGGLGVDTVTGGGGADRYVFSAFSVAASAGPDRITDFSAADGDTVLLNAAEFGLDSVGSGLLILIDESSALPGALATGSPLVYDISSGNLYWNQNGQLAGFGAGGLLAVFENRSIFSFNNISIY